AGGWGAAVAGGLTGSTGPTVAACPALMPRFPARPLRGCEQPGVAGSPARRARSVRADRSGGPRRPWPRVRGQNPIGQAARTASRRPDRSAAHLPFSSACLVGDVRADVLTSAIHARRGPARAVCAGVDYEDVVATLERVGIDKFVASFTELFQGIADKRQQPAVAALPSG